MPRSDPAADLRVPAEDRRRSSGGGGDDRPRLRLVVARGRLGAELEAPYALGPLRATELALSFPDVGFPVELTGGIGAFRHRRGRLERVGIALGAAEAARWARSRLERAVGEPLLHHLVAPDGEGWLVGLATEGGALAFDVVCAPLGADLRLVPTRARGLGLAEPAQLLGQRALAALLAPVGVQRGGVTVVEEVPRRVARAVLPDAGVRIPDARGLTIAELVVDVDETCLSAERDGPVLALGERAVSAVELAALTADAEEALVAGRPEDARRCYLEASGRAPRHPELARRLAELDAAAGGRTEAALATLSDALAPIDAGPLGGRLLAAHGDRQAAATAFRRAGEREPYGPLAARCLVELSALEDDAERRAAVLDRAVARAPMLDDARWARFEQAARLGKVAEARAELEHLEAAASGAHHRHETLVRAAGYLASRRLTEEAQRAYERALRYVPDDVSALAGLARCFSAAGRRRRALEVLSRAVGLCERKHDRRDDIVVELARALAEVADDRPAGIAHLRGIEATSPAVFEARALEARWCAEIGDLAGADAALARLGDAVEAHLGALVDDDGIWQATSPYASRQDARVAIAMHLLEGARMQELDRGDLAAARHLLSLALRLAPRHRGIGEAFRRVAQRLEAPSDSEPAARPPSPERARRRTDVPMPTDTPQVGATPERATDVPTSSDAPESAGRSRERTTDVPMPLTQRRSEPGEAEGEAPSVPEPPPMPRVAEDLDAFADDDGEDEALAERLAEKLRADPGSDAVARELAEALERLGRDHDLLALASGRIDDFGAEPGWVERRRAVLARLRDRAEREGRHDEARLYATMLET